MSMSNVREVYVCPECDSPYLTSQVITEVEINTNYEWEISHISPDDLKESMEHPDNPVYCPRCGWEGQMKERKVVSIMNDSIHEEEPVEYKIPTTLNDIHIVTSSNKPVQINMYDTVVIDGEKYGIIGKYYSAPTIIRKFCPITYRFISSNKERLVMYILTPLNQNNVPTGKYIILTENQLYNLLNAQK